MCIFNVPHGRLEYAAPEAQDPGCAGWRRRRVARGPGGARAGRALTATAMRERPGPAASGGPRVPRPRRAPRVSNSEQRAGGSRAPCRLCDVRTVFSIAKPGTPHTPFRLRGAPSFSVSINSGGPSPVTLPQPRCWPALDREPPLYYLSTTPYLGLATSSPAPKPR